MIGVYINVVVNKNFWKKDALLFHYVDSFFQNEDSFSFWAQKNFNKYIILTVIFLLL